MAQAVKDWLAQALAGQVYWLELRGERQPRVSLASAPIEVGPVLNEQLYQKVPTIVMTSATLSARASDDEGVGDGIRHAQQRLGLHDCSTLQPCRPFDLRAQTELHMFPRIDES